MRFQQLAILALFAILALSHWAPSPRATQCRAAEYDFFDLSRYPVAGKLRSWVELTTEKMEGSRDPKQYNRRTVHWWPRKGVDFVELRDGMIEREWTWAASPLDASCKTKIKGEKTVTEVDILTFPPNAGEGFLRRVRGYITPKETANYTFKVAGYNEVYLYLSSDESTENLRAIAYAIKPTPPARWDEAATQLSKPQRLEAGKKYYYEVVHVDHQWRDYCDIVWLSDARSESPLRGDEFSTLEGKKGTFAIEYWPIQHANFIPVRADEGLPRLPDVPQKFKAHLIGFMGVGNELGEPYENIDFVAPGAVMRFPDGRKRVLHRWWFSREDQRFIMDLYLKELKRVRATLDQTKYTGGDGPAAPGKVIYNSEHFTFVYDAHPENEDPEARGLRDKFYRSALVGAEGWYTYLEYGGHLMQYWDREEKRKHNVGVGGGNGGGYGGCQIGGVSALPIALYHEYSHGMDAWWFGHPEIFCDFGQDLGTGGAADKNSNNFRRPHLSSMQRAYPTCLLYSFLGEDPNWGFCAPMSMPKAQDEPNFFQSLARLVQQRGINKDGLRGAGDIVAQYGAKMAELDMHNHDLLTRNRFAVKRHYLEPLDVTKGTYRIPWDEAPEAYGMNIVRLVPEEGSTEITADLLGYHDPDVYSDWRACLVAVDKDGQTRYSDFWNKGTMTMPRQDGDRRYWLTVTATPTAILNIKSPLGMCSGLWAPRYPWQVTLTGARPGLPQHFRGDTDDYYVAHGAPNYYDAQGPLPTPANTPQDKAFLEKAKVARDAVAAKIPSATDPWLRHRLLAIRARMDTVLADENTQGAPHPHGSGWVAATATVAPTAYVGPGAMVLENAQVLDNAIVEKSAIIRGNACVSGNARVAGQAVIGGDVKLSGYQRTWHTTTGATPSETVPGARQDFHGLWHNYAMDEESKMMLEDRFRARSFGADLAHPIMNGYVFGRPRLIVDGERRAFKFDGRSQYLELNPRAADMGQLTVDLAVRSKGGQNQVLWDFGSDAENCMIFRIDADGKPVFTATVGGKEVVSVAMKATLPAGKWIRLRVEIDGRQIALWMDDQPAGQKGTSFRPADVFPPGQQKRNFVAALRDGKNCFAGAIDYVVIYYLVHGRAFAQLPPPIMDVSCRPTERFAREIVKDAPARKRYEIENKRAVDEAMQYYGKLATDVVIRLHELRNRDPNWPQAIAKAKADLEALNKQPSDQPRKELPEPAELIELKQQRQQFNEQFAKTFGPKEQELRDETAWLESLDKDPKYRQLKARSDADRAKLDAAGQALEVSFDAMPEKVATEKKIAELTATVQNLEEMVKEVDEQNDAAIEAMPVYWDSQVISEENQFLSSLRVQYEGELGRVDGAIQHYRRLQLRREHMASNASYKKAIEAQQELEVLKVLIPEYKKVHLAGSSEHASLESKSRSEDSAQRQFDGYLEQLRQERRQRILGPDYEKMQQRRREIDEQVRAVERQWHDQRRRQDGEHRNKVEVRKAEIRKELRAAYDRAVEPYYSEYHNGVSYLRSAMRGFYNTPYSHHLSAQGMVEKKFRYRDVPGDMEAAIQAYKPENWATDVRAWDWRTRYERDGRADKFPMTCQWLRRVRGDGPMNVVD